MTYYTNLDYLRLMSDGDEDMMQTMLEMLLAELPEELGKIRTLHAEQDWEELSKVSHKMKSTLAFVGNDDMTNANKEIELLAKSKNDLPRLDSLITVLDDNFQPVMEELRKALAR